MWRKGPSFSGRRCQALNGIAILLVVARHVGHRGVMQFGYGMNGWGDSLYFAISNPIQQLLVVTFLFFSGYGVMAQFLRKGESYVDGTFTVVDSTVLPQAVKRGDFLNADGTKRLTVWYNTSKKPYRPGKGKLVLKPGELKFVVGKSCP